ncbi:hypothetical protein MKP08_01770 [Erythrobacter sp. LQ02-29]|uniref:DUF6961 family protein n=1 Tax=Erythrobacter sp. LQ02-29 TaxID=2920384 RepID=UPI001F4DCA16|nr:hypothetical protein [Erythrobacter sp. LQ02-29]MCP9221476.1 hypothetical protein [Erythrobacter sp. LQ02-29]
MVLNRDQELWAVALWVEKNHGKEGPAYIAQQIERLFNEGDEAGIATWKTVAERFDQLSCQSPTS